MAKNNKAKGSARERYVRDHCLKAGAIGFMKAAASLGETDLALFFSRRCLLIQVKSNRWPGTVESETLNKLADRLDHRAYVVATVRVDDGQGGGGGRKPTVRVRIHSSVANGFTETSFEQMIMVARGDTNGPRATGATQLKIIEGSEQDACK